MYYKMYYKNVLEEVECTPFVSISTDASNHGNIKLFPIVLQYFSIKSGLQIKLLDLSTLPNETSESISLMLSSALNEHHILHKLIAFSGDNCNTNFGGKNRSGNNNVYCKLKTTNENLIGVGCPAHIVHNSIEHGFDGLPIDLGSVVQKIISQFLLYETNY